MEREFLVLDLKYPLISNDVVVQKESHPKASLNCFRVQFDF